MIANQIYDILQILMAKNMVKLDGGKNQLSLGYFAETKDHDLYDFEQVNIVPHHLAIVEKGRCGTVCKFNDERMDMDDKKDVNTEEEVVKDAGETPVNIQRISEVVKDLPEAIKLMNIDDLAKLIPALEEAINVARANTPNGQETEEAPEEEAAEETPEEEAAEDTPEEDKKDFKDSQEFKDAVMRFADERVNVILKAKNFLDEDYDFSKDTHTIMRDTLATQTADQFKDEELAVAFKMLKKIENYSNFADATCEFDKLKDKEI